VPAVGEPQNASIALWCYHREDARAESVLASATVEKRGVDLRQHFRRREAHSRQSSSCIADQSGDRVRFGSRNAHVADEQTPPGWLRVLGVTNREHVVEIAADDEIAAGMEVDAEVQPGNRRQVGWRQALLQSVRYFAFAFGDAFPLLFEVLVLQKTLPVATR